MRKKRNSYNQIVNIKSPKGDSSWREHIIITVILSSKVKKDSIEQCFTSPPTQYRLYGRRFLRVKRPNQQHQSTEGTYSTQTNQTYNKQTWTQNRASPLVYNNMGWLGDGSHRGQGCQAWTAVASKVKETSTYKTKKVIKTVHMIDNTVDIGMCEQLQL